MLNGLFERLINRVADLFPPGFWLNDTFSVRALLVIVLVSLICGAVGALVVGNRMSFFSDALAHCAFAGVALGILLSLAARNVLLEGWLVPFVMVTFGVAVGVMIAYVREKTGLANDTVIGVFFAFAVGFGGMLLGSVQVRTNFNPESFLWGSPLFVQEQDLLAIFVLAVVLAIVLVRRYNHFVLASFNPSLARSRNIPLRWCNYLFIILLALIVNLCIQAVGALLINAMLVVPAATAANFGRNLRQMFRCSIALSLLAGVAGLWFSSTVQVPLGRGQALDFAPGGTIVVLSVAFFFLSVGWKSLSERNGGRRASLATVGAGVENASIASEPPAGKPA
jgi:zinc transport system permease protein